MIDWVTALLPLDWEKPLNGGKIVQTDENGKVTKEIVCRKNLGGAYDATFGARTIVTKEEKKFLELSGNPIKYFQGHNLFGTNKLIPLVLRLANLIATMSGNEPTEQNLKDWENGNWTISRLDVTEMITRFAGTNGGIGLDTMKLSDVKIRNAKPAEKPYKLPDEAGLTCTLIRMDASHGAFGITVCARNEPSLSLEPQHEKLSSICQS